jgi:tRNA(adenine34) deaminase
MPYPAMFTDHDHSCMRRALEEAKKAALSGEVPIGAVLTNSKTGEILAAAGNQTITRSDPTAHAEILAIRDYCAQMGAQRIPECDLYVTLEPCTMCAGAIAFARINRLVFAASDPKGGGVLHGVQFFKQPTCHHKIKIDHGLMAEDCAKLLKDFFAQKR